MADYRKHYPEILALGASLAAVSVDPPQKSEVVRRELNLPFPILCDTDRCVVKSWAIYNAGEKGGIAKPSVFIIDSGRKLRYHSVDIASSRVPASEIVRILQMAAGASPGRRKLYFPRPGDWIRAVRNAIRLGTH